MIDNWSDLAPLLREPGDWIECTAWAAGGGDPGGCEIRIKGGRQVYEFCTAFPGPRADRVRLGHLDDLREVKRWVRADVVVEIRRVFPRGGNGDRFD